MNISKIYKIAFTSLLVIGCSGVQKKAGQESLAQSVPALTNENYASVGEYEKVHAADCPAGDASWRKESLKNLVKYANACYLLKKADRLEVLGNHISQKFHLAPWGAYYLSLAAQAKGDYARALWMIELALKKSPKTALLIYQKGRVYWDMADFSRAVDSYSLALKENPNFIEAHVFLAQLYYREQNFKLAEKHFLAVTQAKSNSGQAFAGLAESRMAQSNSNSVVELYEKAVNLSPRNIQYRVRLAGLYESSQKDIEQALSAYKKIRELAAESAANRGLIGFDLNEKIKSLEESIGRQVSSNKKVTKVESKKAGVKK